MSVYADQNHAPSLTCVRLEIVKGNSDLCDRYVAQVRVLFVLGELQKAIFTNTDNSGKKDWKKNEKRGTIRVMKNIV